MLSWGELYGCMAAVEAVSGFKDERPALCCLSWMRVE
jgi:hypothetical protein